MSDRTSVADPGFPEWGTNPENHMEDEENCAGGGASKICQCRSVTVHTPSENFLETPMSCNVV